MSYEKMRGLVRISTNKPSPSAHCARRGVLHSDSVPFDYTAGPPFPRGNFAQSLIDLAFVAFAAVFICTTAIAIGAGAFLLCMSVY